MNVSALLLELKESQITCVFTLAGSRLAGRSDPPRFSGPGPTPDDSGVLFTVARLNEQVGGGEEGLVYLLQKENGPAVMTVFRDRAN